MISFSLRRQRRPGRDLRRRHRGRDRARGPGAHLRALLAVPDRSRHRRAAARGSACRSPRRSSEAHGGTIDVRERAGARLVVPDHAPGRPAASPSAARRRPTRIAQRSRRSRAVAIRAVRRRRARGAGLRPVVTAAGRIVTANPVPRCEDPRVNRSLRRLSVLTLAATLLLVTVGGLVRASGSGLGCPGWPRCYGYWFPPFGQHGEALRHALIEYSHRFLTTITVILIILLVVVAWWRKGERRAPTAWAATVALVLILVQAGLGAAVVKSELDPRAGHAALRERDAAGGHPGDRGGDRVRRPPALPRDRPPPPVRERGRGRDGGVVRGDPPGHVRARRERRARLPRLAADERQGHPRPLGAARRPAVRPPARGPRGLRRHRRARPHGVERRAGPAAGARAGAHLRGPVRRRRRSWAPR